LLWKVKVFSSLPLKDSSSFSLNTIHCGTSQECDIEIIKKNQSGKTLWRKVIGGSSYDKAGGFLKTETGELYVVGSTSSFGKGNYGIWIIKVDVEGRLIWANTYVDYLNEYGFKIYATKEEDNFQVIGIKQECKTINVSNQCIMKDWKFTIDKNGEII
jgi:hypothetical protein